MPLSTRGCSALLLSILCVSLISSALPQSERQRENQDEKNHEPNFRALRSSQRAMAKNEIELWQQTISQYRPQDLINTGLNTASMIRQTVALGGEM
jgi:hypothetical protein